jgi:hypothetical protein
VDDHGNVVNQAEVYDPVQERFSVSTPTTGATASQLLDPAPVLMESIPADHAVGVALNLVVALRFSEPMNVTTVNSATATLEGPNGPQTSSVVPAEGGMLAFITPASSLQPGTTYTVKLSGMLAQNRLALDSPTTFSFTTGGGSGGGANEALSTSSNEFGADSVWLPTSDWLTHLPASPWQSLPPLKAPSGVTALSGQVLTINGNPLPNVTLQVGNRRALSDATGRFLIPGVAAGNGVMLIDGTSANANGRTFGIFQPGVAITQGVTTVLNYTIWMPVLDTAHAVTLPSPTTQQTVVTNPYMPGLELLIPSGTSITDIHGQLVRTITMTPVPLDRPPFPLPVAVQVPIYFTVQPGGAQLWSGKGQCAWAQLIYPNSFHYPPGTTANFWDYAPAEGGWYVYGLGKVSADGKTVVPNPGVGFYEFTGAMEAGFPDRTPTNGPGGDAGGDPIDTSTGIFISSHTDLYLSDVIPINLTRVYLSQDSNAWSFGVGTSDNYDIYLTNLNNTPEYQYITLILADGEQVQYTNTAVPNTVFETANFVPTLTTDPSYYGSVITWNGTCPYDGFGC